MLPSYAFIPVLQYKYKRKEIRQKPVIVCYPIYTFIPVLIDTCKSNKTRQKEYVYHIYLFIPDLLDIKEITCNETIHSVLPYLFFYPYPLSQRKNFEKQECPIRIINIVLSLFFQTNIKMIKQVRTSYHIYSLC